jgi:hypothetical protein
MAGIGDERPDLGMGVKIDAHVDFAVVEAEVGKAAGSRLLLLEFLGVHQNDDFSAGVDCRDGWTPAQCFGPETAVAHVARQRVLGFHRQTASRTAYFPDGERSRATYIPAPCCMAACPRKADIAPVPDAATENTEIPSVKHKSEHFPNDNDISPPGDNDLLSWPLKRGFLLSTIKKRSVNRACIIQCDAAIVNNFVL